MFALKPAVAEGRPQATRLRLRHRVWVNWAERSARTSCSTRGTCLKTPSRSAHSIGDELKSGKTLHGCWIGLGSELLHLEGTDEIRVVVLQYGPLRRSLARSVPRAGRRSRRL